MRALNLALPLALVALASCETRTVPSPWKDPRQGEKVARLTIEPDWTDIAVGERATLRARAFDASGTELTDVRFAWLDRSSVVGTTLVSPQAEGGNAEKRFGPELVVEGLNFYGSALELAVADANGYRLNAVRATATVAVHPGGVPTELLVSPPGETLSLAVGELRHVAAFVYSKSHERLPRSPLQFQVEGDCLELRLPQDVRDQQAVVRGRCEGTAKVTVSAPPLTKTLAVTVVPASQMTPRPPPEASFVNPKQQNYRSPLLLLDAEERPFVFFLSTQVLLAQWAGTGWDVMPAHPYDTAALKLEPTVFRLDPQGRPAFVGSDQGHVAFFRYDPTTGRFGSEVLDRAHQMEVISWGEKDGRPGFWPCQLPVSDSPGALAFDRKTGQELVAFTRQLRIPAVPVDRLDQMMMLATREGSGFQVEPLPFVERKLSLKLPDRKGSYSWPLSHHDFPPHLDDTADGLGLLVFEPPPENGYQVPEADYALRQDGQWRFFERRGPGKVASAQGPDGTLHLFWRGYSYEHGAYTSAMGGSSGPANGYCDWDYSLAVDPAGRPHYLGGAHYYLNRYGDWRGTEGLSRAATLGRNSEVVELREDGCTAGAPGCQLRVVHRRPAWDYGSPAVRVVPGERTEQTGFRVVELDDGAVGLIAGQYRDPKAKERGFAELTFQATRDGVRFTEPVAVGGWAAERHDADLFLAARGSDVYALSGTDLTFLSVSHDRGAHFQATYQLKCHPGGGLAVDGSGAVWLFTFGATADGCGLRRSTDRGETFTPVPLPFEIASANLGLSTLSGGELVAVATRALTIDRSRRAPGADAWSPVESVDASPEEPFRFAGPFALPNGDVYLTRLIGVGPQETRTFVLRVLRWAAGASTVESAEFPLSYDDHNLELRHARVFALASGTYLSFTVSGHPLPFRSELRRLEGAKAGPPLDQDQGLQGGSDVHSAKRSLQVVELGGKLQHFWIDGREPGFGFRQENLYTRAFEVQR